MADINKVPNPAGSPIEKLITVDMLEQLAPQLLSRLSENPTREEILSAFMYYDGVVQNYLARHNRALGEWANIHTHPGGGSGVEGWPPPPEWVALYNSDATNDDTAPAIKLWDYANNVDLTADMPTRPSWMIDAGTSGGHTSVSWHPDGRRVSCTWNNSSDDAWGVLNLQDYTSPYWETLPLLGEVLKGMMKFSPDGNLLACLNEAQSKPLIMNYATDKLWQDYFIASNVSGGLAWSPDGNYIAALGRQLTSQPRVVVWGVSSGAQVPITGVDTNLSGLGPLWTPNMKYLLYGRGIIDWESKEHIVGSPVGLPGITAGAVTPDSRYVLHSVSSSPYLEVYDLETMSDDTSNWDVLPLNTVALSGISVSPELNVAAVSRDNRALTFYDLDTKSILSSGASVLTGSRAAWAGRGGSWACF